MPFLPPFPQRGRPPQKPSRPLPPTRPGRLKRPPGLRMRGGARNFWRARARTGARRPPCFSTAQTPSPRRATTPGRSCTTKRPSAFSARFTSRAGTSLIRSLTAENGTPPAPSLRAPWRSRARILREYCARLQNATWSLAGIPRRSPALKARWPFPPPTRSCCAPRPCACAKPARKVACAPSAASCLP